MMRVDDVQEWCTSILCWRMNVGGWMIEWCTSILCWRMDD